MHIFLAFIFGTIIGSFINVVVLRLRAGMRGIFTGRSACPHCHHVLTPMELVPIVSFFMLGRKCRSCRRAISWQYPLVEALTGFVFALVVYTTWTMPVTYFTIATTMLALSYATALMIVAVYDARFMEIPDSIMLPALFVALLMTPLSFTPTLRDSLLGAAIPVGLFGFLIIISRGAWMGLGDVRIGAFMGWILGWQNTLVALAIAYLAGSIISLALIASGKKKRTDVIPFGPFLVLGTLLAFVGGTAAIQWYMMIIGMI